MKCREVKRALVAYQDGEVMPSERTLIEAHLAGCASCERELAALGSGRRRLAGSLKSAAAQAAPSPEAWSHLQEKLAAEAPSPGDTRRATHGATKLTRYLRTGDHPMKLRWRIALGTAGAVVLAAAVIVAVPTSRAAAGGFFADVFNIHSGPQATLGYLPAGFKAEAITSVGSGSVSAKGEDLQSEEQTLYRAGDQFLLVKTSTDKGQPLPQGKAATVNGVAAVLGTGLSGSATVAPPVLDGAQVGTVTVSAAPGGPTNIVGSTGGTIVGDGSGVVTPASGSAVAGGSAAVAPPDGAVIEEGSASVSADPAGTPVTDISGGDAPEVPAVDYTNGSRLTWVVDGTRVEILSNLSVDELMKIAEGLVLSH
jgi:hypothetical protein